MEDKLEEKVTDLWDQKYELLDDYEDSIIALAIHCELTLEELDDLEESSYSNTEFKVNGDDYFCGTESEMMIAVEDYMSESIWAFCPSFLGDYGSLYKMNYFDIETILKALQEQCEGANDAIKALVDWDENKEEMVTDAISADGFAHFLNSYDGNGDEISVNDETYYICRM